MKKLYFFIVAFFPIGNALAAYRNKTVFEYFTDNFLVQVIISGGYYSLAIMVATAIIAVVFKKLRVIILSVLLAIFGLLLVIFIFEAFDNMQWIPAV